MRTPDSDETDTDGAESGTGATGSLADGFGAADPDADASVPEDSAFGSGWPGEPDDESDRYDETGSDENIFTREAGLPDADDAEATSAFEFDPDYVATTDTDLDLTGDGLVDNADLHEAVTSIFDFDIDDASGPGGHGHHHVDDGHVDG